MTHQGITVGVLQDTINPLTTPISTIQYNRLIPVVNVEWRHHNTTEHFTEYAVRLIVALFLGLHITSVCSMGIAAARPTSCTHLIDGNARYVVLYSKFCKAPAVPRDQLVIFWLWNVRHPGKVSDVVCDT